MASHVNVICDVVQGCAGIAKFLAKIKTREKMEKLCIAYRWQPKPIMSSMRRVTILFVFNQEFTNLHTFNTHISLTNKLNSGEKGSSKQRETLV